MHLICFLKEIRGTRPLRSVADEAGVNPGMLSRIENGMALPKDDQIPMLEAAYRAQVTDWYPKGVLLALTFDGDEVGQIRERMRTTLLPANMFQTIA